MSARFEVYRRKGLRRSWGFRLIDGNGEPIAGSQGYVSKSNAERGVQNLVVTVSEMMKTGYTIVDAS